jgi:hypothetical protein
MGKELWQESASRLAHLIRTGSVTSCEDLCLDAAQVVEESVGVLTPIDPRG